MGKKLAICFVILLLAVGAGVHFLFSNLDSIVIRAVEKYGSEATGTTVKLEKAKIAITDGKGELEGLSVGNPKGFSSKNALTVGGIRLSIDASSITGDGPIIVPEVDVDRPQITYELAGDGKNNLQALQKNTAEAPAAEAGKSPADKSERKVIITDLYIRDGQVQVDSPLLKGRSLTAPLPLIHLHDVGKASKGATQREVAQQIAKAVTDSAMASSEKAARKVLGDALSLAGSAGDEAGKLGGKAGGLLKNFGLGK